ncbi:nitroreductase family protein [Methanoregula sp.]|uniref:nitroreductase family protein n=1 Tax=Methanoregula sp. TaxID=2052170 RepID=UPI002B947809|nr:nitroreductase family protein [Methanoregula sp.]HVP96674.1 nitroreductase family protein [Methanoregula sp.]
MNVVTAIIKGRHSVRKFKPDPVDETYIHDAIECAVHAPTAMNLQPWLIGVIRSKDLLKKIAAVTDHGKFIADAPVCFAVFGERNTKYYLEDCSAATENLILGLQAYGVGSCWVAGDKKEYAEELRTLLNVPEKYTLVSLVPAGLPQEITPAPKKDTKIMVFSDVFKKE